MADRRKRGAGAARTRRLRRLGLAAVAIGVTGLAITLYGASLLRALDLSTMDVRFSIRGAQKAPKDIVLVEVDDQTLAMIGYDWPFPRRIDAQVQRDINAGGPRAVAWDVQFGPASPCPSVGLKPPPPNGNCNEARSDETALLNALFNAPRPVVVSITAPNAVSNNFPFLGAANGRLLLADANGRPADGNFPIDPSNFERRVAYSLQGLPTFAVATAEVAERRAINPAPFNGSSGAWIDYAGPANTFHHVSFVNVFSGAIKPSFFHDKVVVIGSSATVLQDFHPTPTDPFMPGMEVQANAISTVLRGLPLRSVPGWVNIALIVLLGVATPLASLRFGPIATLGLFALLAAVFTVSVQLAFNNGKVVSYIYPVGALLFSTAGALAVHTITSAFERERVRDLFSRFVPEDVVGEVLAATGDGLRLGGVERFATVMFTDLRGFTSSAENMSPDDVIDVLNHYLSEMSDSILDHGGTLVAYMGDGIMAVFGAPIASSDHADRALATARDMVSVRLARFNAWMKERGLGDGYRMGIGLNTGRVMSGNVGSERRVEYTSVGDATNTAARIEGLTKGTPHQLMFSQATLEAMNDKPGDVMFVQEVQIRGRTQVTDIYSVRDGTDPDAFSPGRNGDPAGADAGNAVAVEGQPETA